MSGNAFSFDETKRAIVVIEHKIDNCLRAFNKIRNQHPRGSVQWREEAKLLTGEEDYEVMKNELDDLFTEFKDKVDELSEHAELVKEPAKLRTVQRYQEIYRSDYSEYRRVQKVLDETISNQSNSITVGRSSASSSRRTDYALRENDSAESSVRLLDEHISIAMETRGRLGDQRNLLRSVQGRMNTMFNHFPQVNSLVQRIHGRHRREAIIVGLVVGALTILCLARIFF